MALIIVSESLQWWCSFSLELALIWLSLSSTR